MVDVLLSRFHSVVSYYQSRGVRVRLSLFDVTMLILGALLLCTALLAVSASYMKAKRNHQFVVMRELIDRRHELSHEVTLLTRQYQELTTPGNLMEKAQDIYVNIASLDQVISEHNLDSRTAVVLERDTGI